MLLKLYLLAMRKTNSYVLIAGMRFSLFISSEIGIQSTHSDEITTQYKPGFLFCPKYNECLERDAFVVWLWWSCKFKNF